MLLAAALTYLNGGLIIYVVDKLNIHQCYFSRISLMKNKLGQLYYKSQ